MTYILADRVFETSTSTGTGSFNLAGSTTGFRTFVAGVGTGNTCNYEINNGTDWEIGIGTITAGSPDVLSRDTVTASSNSGAKVNWGSGTKNVFLPLIASNTVIDSKENTFTALQKIDNIQTSGSSGVTLKNSAGSSVAIFGAAAGLEVSFSGKVNTVLSATTGAGLNIPHGAAPTSPVNGDIWTTTSGTFVRINGVTQSIGALPNGSQQDSTYAEYTANADLTTQIPLDDTIPQNTEGTQILSAAITPKTATNKVRIRISGAGALSSNGSFIVALYGSGANALGAWVINAPTTNVQVPYSFEFEHSPASLSPQTYTVRSGPTSALTLRMNGTSSARLLGGASRCTITLEEIVS